MAPTRREFLEQTAAGLVAAGLSPLPSGGRARPQAGGSLRVLILGGTTFLGPHQVRVLLERGHQVSIFTRGRTRPPLFPELFERVEHLIGDREGDLSALAGRSWDAVIENSGRRVEWTRDSARLLQDAARNYLYVSSTGVYFPYRTTDIRETGPVLMADDSPRDPPSYGVMKARSEREVEQAFGERAIIVRPQYIVGPADASDRFTYWPARVHRGGNVLVPGRQDDPVQYIDVRDLTEWMVGLIERGTTGVFNGVGPASPLTMAEFVYGLRAVTSATIQWTWIDDHDFLVAHNLRYAIPWLLPAGDSLGAARINHERAVKSGLAFRPLAVTARDTLDWWLSDAVPEERRRTARFAIMPEREAELLAAWARRS